MRNRSQSGITLMELLVSMTLLSLLSVGMLFAMRVGLNSMGKTNEHFNRIRRVMGVERILTEQVAGFMATAGFCGSQGGPPTKFPFFQGDFQTMRFVSSYSLQEAARGYPRILEYQVIPSEDGQSVRLIVNESLYTGPLSTGARCGGVAPDPTGVLTVLWRPVTPSPQSYVLADRLARCQFSFKEETLPDKPSDFWHSHWPKEFTPAAVRIDMAPLLSDPAHIQLPPVVAPFRVTRLPLSEYSDTN
ncbi:MAG: prepilin-type N-terminal cleavage/methylation domain-containing protein [Bryobacteraceae bacterium]|nr:prepilin-type N-terminal cleavage/methylation domain-containing protein [Bryobacteraceae bacterium]